MPHHARPSSVTQGLPISCRMLQHGTGRNRQGEGLQRAWYSQAGGELLGQSRVNRVVVCGEIIKSSLHQVESARVRVSLGKNYKSTLMRSLLLLGRAPSTQPGPGTQRNLDHAVTAINTSKNHIIMEKLRFQEANWQTKEITWNHECRD